MDCSELNNINKVIHGNLCIVLSSKESNLLHFKDGGGEASHQTILFVHVHQ